MEEADFEWQLGVAPPGIVRPVADVVILLVSQGGQLFRLIIGGLFERAGRELLGVARHVVEAESKGGLACRQPGKQHERGP